jgi:predicted nucleic acid-binding protein
LLLEVYGRVLVPTAVPVEMQHPDAPEEVRAWAAAPPTWLEQVQVLKLDESLAAELGAGEREAIGLALEIRADLLLIDELAGRREAEARQIDVAGTLAVLLKASRLGYFEFPDALRRLRHFGFRVARPIEEIMLARYREALRTRS